MTTQEIDELKTEFKERIVEALIAINNSGYEYNNSTPYPELATAITNEVFKKTKNKESAPNPQPA